MCTWVVVHVPSCFLKSSSKSRLRVVFYWCCVIGVLLMLCQHKSYLTARQTSSSSWGVRGIQTYEMFHIPVLFTHCTLCRVRLAQINVFFPRRGSKRFSLFVCLFVFTWFHLCKTVCTCDLFPEPLLSSHTGTSLTAGCLAPPSGHFNVVYLKNLMWS